MTDLWVDICKPEDENLIHRKAQSVATPCDPLVPFDVHKVADTREEGMHIVAVAAVGIRRS
jgi:hypothetical protein